NGRVKRTGPAAGAPVSSPPAPCANARSDRDLRTAEATPRRRALQEPGNCCPQSMAWGRSLLVLAGRIEHRVRQVDPEGAQPIAELGAYPAGLEAALHEAVLPQAGLPEGEDLLRRDHFAFHAGDLLDAGDLAPTV